MSEEEQEKLYELLFKDTKNKLEETIEEQQNKIASQEKQIKLMQSCDLAKVVKKQEKEIEELKQENKDHLEALTEWVNGERINDIKHISKDKIRKEKEEIEEMLFKEKNKNAKIEFSYAIGVLEELLEE